MTGERAVRAERGLTIVELLITVTIMGAIVSVLLTVIVQSFTVLPASTERTATAAQRARLVDAVSDDIANAASNVAPMVPIVGVATNDCVTVFSAQSLFGIPDARAFVGGVRLPRVSGPEVQYQGALQTFSPTHHKVTIFRIVSGTVQRVLVGYCAIDTTNILKADYSDPTVTLTLKLAPSPNAPMETFVISGSRRTIG